MKVKSVMSTKVEVLDCNDTLSLADDLMKMRRIRHLPVLDGGVMVGVVSQRDLFHAALSTVMNFDAKTEDDFLKLVVIREVMVKKVITIGADADVREAARIMFAKKIGCLPVVDGKKLVGMASEADLLRVIVGE